MMAVKQVLVTYTGRNRIIKIPQECDNELTFLADEFFQKFDVNANSKVSFQRFDSEWGCYVELDGCEVNNKDKLEALVTLKSSGLGSSFGSITKVSFVVIAVLFA